MDVLDSLSEGGNSLDGLREQLITPGLEESGDPMSMAKPVTV